MAFAADGAASLTLDGRRVGVQQVQVDQWRSVGQGTTIQLAAGPHEVRVTVAMADGGRSVVRWNWVPPAVAQLNLPIRGTRGPLGQVIGSNAEPFEASSTVPSRSVRMTIEPASA